MLLAVVVSDRDVAAETHRIDGWRISVAQWDEKRLLAAVPDVLSDDERKRFDAMGARDAADLRRMAHVIKREALAARLGAPAHHIQFVADSVRPLLAPPHDHIHVSLSHTHGAVAVASSLAAVGIDLEPIARADDPQRLAARYLAPEEARVIERAGNGAGFEFAWRWVAKEALLKARGLSLRAALATSLGDQPQFADDLPFGVTTDDIAITIFAPADGYLCAVAGAY